MNGDIHNKLILSIVFVSSICHIIRKKTKCKWSQHLAGPDSKLWVNIGTPLESL
jgi:hypothetical protein